MALIKCYECGESISNKAIICPKCGFPIREELEAKDRFGRDFNVSLEEIGSISFLMSEKNKEDLEKDELPTFIKSQYERVSSYFIYEGEYWNFEDLRKKLYWKSNTAYDVLVNMYKAGYIEIFDKN
jgi:hypothetical protein